MREQPDTQVAIIGNGPAGLSLSAFLSGVSPYYNARVPHPDPLVHERLMENLGESLLDQDLSWAGQLDEFGRLRPISALYDSLVRPDTDIGSNLPSSLQWAKDDTKFVDHVILGESPVGGSWNDYDKEMMAVSFCNWLDLPGYSISEWLGGIPLVSRLPSIAITEYMRNYAIQLGIRPKLRSRTKVTRIEKDGELWRVSGRDPYGVAFSLTAKRVVLACGKTSYKKLEVLGEDEEKNIVYDIAEMKSRISRDKQLMRDYTMGMGAPVVVVGDGISSADAIRHCLEHHINVVHVMRKSVRQLKGVMMSRLSANHYPEYAKVYRLMTDIDSNPFYKKINGSKIERFQKGSLIISTQGKEIVQPFALCVVCIGRTSDFLSILDKPYTFYDYTAEEDPTLMSVGSFAGEHFVRYLVGGCLDVARTIHSSLKDVQNPESALPEDMSRSFSSASSASSDESLTV